MAVDPTVERRGSYILYKWVLTSADQTANPTTRIGAFSEKSVDLQGVSDAAGWNSSTIQLHGINHPDGTYKLLNTIPDTTDLTFTAAASKAFVILPNVLQVKPVVTSGTLGATGVPIYLLVTAARSHTV